jgi:hypothetical protein
MAMFVLHVPVLLRHHQARMLNINGLVTVPGMCIVLVCERSIWNVADDDLGRPLTCNANATN